MIKWGPEDTLLSSFNLPLLSFPAWRNSWLLIGGLFCPAFHFLQSEIVHNKPNTLILLNMNILKGVYNV